LHDHQRDQDADQQVDDLNEGNEKQGEHLSGKAPALAEACHARQGWRNAGARRRAKMMEVITIPPDRHAERVSASIAHWQCPYGNPLRIRASCAIPLSSPRT
jgi:hypothetical protein